MATLNKVMLIGRLTDDPEPPRTLPNSGNTVVKFRFAVGRSKKNASGGWDPDPNPLYIDCEAFSRGTDNTKTCDLISQYCRKGSEIFLEGRLQLDNWDDKQTGQKRSKHKIVVDNIQFVGGRNEGEGGGFNRGESGGGGYNRGNDEGGGYNRGGNSGGRPAMGGGRSAGGAPAGKPAGGGRPGGGYSPPPADDDFHGGGGGDGGDGDPIPF